MSTDGCLLVVFFLNCRKFLYSRVLSGIFMRFLEFNPRKEKTCGGRSVCVRVGSNNKRGRADIPRGEEPRLSFSLQIAWIRNYFSYNPHFHGVATAHSSRIPIFFSSSLVRPFFDELRGAKNTIPFRQERRREIRGEIGRSGVASR